MRLGPWVLAVLLLAAGSCAAGLARSSRGASRPPLPPNEAQEELYAAADQVLATMSRILDLPVKAPLKKALRSRTQIRAYLLREQRREESAKEEYANQKTLEAFGLIPKGFPLNSFMIDLLTDQVAGYYDPDRREFYIADWISPAEQKPVMAHELTHALDDEYFHLKKWEKAPGKNDDADMAREAVVEGSAMAAMLDYSLRGLHVSVRQMPALGPFLEASVVGNMAKDPKLQKAPPFLRDELVFPYLNGAIFTQSVLKRTSGWPDFKKIFENPPVSTQQILHPDLYFKGVKPRKVRLPHPKSAVPRGYRELDENVVGEFALEEILKQYMGDQDAVKISSLWAGDRYALFENKATKQLLLLVLYAVDSAQDTPRFFRAYRSLLEKKYAAKSVSTAGSGSVHIGGAYLRCYGTECLDVEGGNERVMNKMARNLHWPG